MRRPLLLLPPLINKQTHFFSWLTVINNCIVLPPSGYAAHPKWPAEGICNRLRQNRRGIPQKQTKQKRFCFVSQKTRPHKRTVGQSDNRAEWPVS